MAARDSGGAGFYLSVSAHTVHLDEVEDESALLLNYDETEEMGMLQVRSPLTRSDGHEEGCIVSGVRLNRKDLALLRAAIDKILIE